MSKSVFITGATGYIGGATLAHLLTASSSKSHKYSALVRNKNKAAKLEALGVRAVLGSLDDADILIEEASKADVVIHTAESAEHVPSVKAILEGLIKRDDNPIYIHISGTGVLASDARGEYATDIIYSDLDSAQVNSIPDTAFHRDVELLVLNASSSGKIRTHIVTPSTIYGISDHILVQESISNSISMQIPEFIRASIARGQGGVLGKGENLWSNIHISEIASLIATVFEASLEGKTATEYKQYDVAVEVAKALHVKGIGKPEPVQFSDEEIKKYYGGSYHLGSNSRCRGGRPRALGWKPTHTNTDFLKSIA
ncbi:hypothetical protein BU17DRAFT_77845 [Hysterangium stoloniferum]|nr:hypothetical protein BU17DRAFT_77845 [Hysterangium stoloniferum]